MAEIAKQHITAGSPLKINPDNGSYVAYAEEIVLRGDASEKDKGKELLTYIEEAINSITPGGGSGGDVTINDAILGGGLSFKDNKIELNLEDYFKIENDTLGIKLGTVFRLDSDNNITIRVSDALVINSNSALTVKTYDNGGIKVGSFGLELNYNASHFIVKNNVLQLVNPNGGGGDGNYILPKASGTELGGVKIGTDNVFHEQNPLAVPLAITNTGFLKLELDELVDNKEFNKTVGTQLFGLGAYESGNGLYLGTDNDNKFIVKEEHLELWYSSKDRGGSSSNIIGDESKIDELVGYEKDLDGSVYWGLDYIYIKGGNEQRPGPRIIYFDDITVNNAMGWPVTGVVSGYIVLDKGHNGVPNGSPSPTSSQHSQTLYIINGSGSDYKIFTRHGVASINAEDSNKPSWGFWKEVQTMSILLGPDGSVAVGTDQLDEVVDNGMYGGILQTDEFNMADNGVVTGIETFTLIVVNNYAITEEFCAYLAADDPESPFYNMRFPKQVIQYKISNPLYGTPIYNNTEADDIDPTLYEGKVAMRTGVHHIETDAYKWGEWKSIGGSVPIV